MPGTTAASVMALLVLQSFTLLPSGRPVDTLTVQAGAGNSHLWQSLVAAISARYPEAAGALGAAAPAQGDLRAARGAVDAAVLESLAFLLAHMPARDHREPNVTGSFLLEQTQLAVQARRATRWARSVPWERFLNDVAPYAVLAEPRDGAWRPLLHRKLMPLVANASSVTEAAQRVNQRLWGLWDPPIVFVADQTPAIMSPFQVLSHRYASCTGMSTLLVDALRSVGVPARAVGTAHWNTPEGGNHVWVEFWEPTAAGGAGAWSFTGAGEYNGKLNSTWFFPYPAKLQTPGDSALCNGSAILASSFRTPTEGSVWWPLYWEADARTGACPTEAQYIPALDVTRSYLAATRALPLTAPSYPADAAAEGRSGRSDALLHRALSWVWRWGSAV